MKVYGLIAEHHRFEGDTASIFMADLMYIFAYKEWEIAQPKCP
jgi:hypothetical protein